MHSDRVEFFSLREVPLGVVCFFLFLRTKLSMRRYVLFQHCVCYNFTRMIVCWMFCLCHLQSRKYCVYDYSAIPNWPRTADNGECLCLHRVEGYFIYRGVVIEPLTDGNEIFTAHRKFCVLKPTAEKDCCVRKPEQLCFGSHAECFSLSGRGFCVHTWRHVFYRISGKNSR